MQTETRTRPGHRIELANMGFNLKKLDFLRWLIANGRDPEFFRVEEMATES